MPKRRYSKKRRGKQKGGKPSTQSVRKGNPTPRTVSRRREPRRLRNKNLMVLI